MTEQSVDAIVTDHTPHPTNHKERPFDQAESGSVGLETTLAVALSTGEDHAALLRALSWRPAELLGLGAPLARAIRPGHAADIAVIDPTVAYTPHVGSMATLGTNSALEGCALVGRARATLVAGRLVVDDYEVAA